MEVIEMAKKVRDMMTAEPRSAEPTLSLAEAAQLMKDEDVGSLPIVEEGRLVAVLTDRDIVVRAVAEGVDAKACGVRKLGLPCKRTLLDRPAEFTHPTRTPIPTPPRCRARDPAADSPTKEVSHEEAALHAPRSRGRRLRRHQRTRGRDCDQAGDDRSRQEGLPRMESGSDADDQPSPEPAPRRHARGPEPGPRHA